MVNIMLYGTWVKEIHATNDVPFPHGRVESFE